MTDSERIAHLEAAIVVLQQELTDTRAKTKSYIENINTFLGILIRHTNYQPPPGKTLLRPGNIELNNLTNANNFAFGSIVV